MESWPDKKIARVALWYIRQHCMGERNWLYTRLEVLHEQLVPLAGLDANELPVVSCFVDSTCWYVMSSRRIVGSNRAPFERRTLDIKHWEWGDFKHGGLPALETFAMVGDDNIRVTAIYETGLASMAPIYYVRFWNIKYPILDKLAV